jgi:peptidoglycan/LPS O-acetylase OafA/YrhL
VEQVATGLEEPTKKPQSRFYRPELDVLRFLAFTMVFIDHALPFDGMFTDGRWLGSVRYAGGFGVCLFFMLSSFLITDLLEREHEATGDIHLKAFYVRRVLRIWPLYFAFLFFDFFVQLSRHNGHFPVGKLLAFLLIAGNWYVSRFEVPLTLSSPLWSISVEEQFYLVWPPYRKYVGRLGSIVFAVVTLVLSYVVPRTCATFKPGTSGRTAFFNFSSSALEPCSHLLCVAGRLVFQPGLAWRSSPGA